MQALFNTFTVVVGDELTRLKGQNQLNCERGIPHSLGEGIAVISLAGGIHREYDIYFGFQHLGREGDRAVKLEVGRFDVSHILQFVREFELINEAQGQPIQWGNILAIPVVPA